MPHLIFFAHPGHELLLYDSLQRLGPRVSVLTDGSGGSGPSRTEGSRALLEERGATILEPFGAYPDWVVYRAILDGDVQFFLNFAQRLFAAALEYSVDTLTSDQIEHCNPVHDLCCVLATLVSRQLENGGRPVRRLVCPIEADRQDSPAYLHVVPPTVLQEKARAVLTAESLQWDVSRLLEARSALLEREALYDLPAPDILLPEPEGEPIYEAYGRQQLEIRGGGELITYQNHLRPLVERLERSFLTR